MGPSQFPSRIVNNIYSELSYLSHDATSKQSSLTNIVNEFNRLTEDNKIAFERQRPDLYYPLRELVTEIEVTGDTQIDLNRFFERIVGSTSPGEANNPQDIL